MSIERTIAETLTPIVDALIAVERQQEASRIDREALMADHANLVARAQDAALVAAQKASHEAIETTVGSLVETSKLNTSILSNIRNDNITVAKAVIVAAIGRLKGDY